MQSRLISFRVAVEVLLMTGKEVLVGLIKRFRIDTSRLDDFCYDVYSIFKDHALSMAIERPSCSRIVILGKDFEVRLYISHSGEGVLTLFFTLLPEATTAGNLGRTLALLLKTLSSMITASSDPVVVVRNVVFSSVKSVNNLIASLTSMGIVLESIDKKIVNGFEILTLRGFYIGENLKKYTITLSFVTSDRNEIGVTVETRVNEELLHNLNTFLNYVKKMYSFILDLENSLVSSNTA